MWSEINDMVRDPSTADGIVADATVAAMRHIDRDKPRYFFAWLFQIARNLARHWLGVSNH